MRRRKRTLTPSVNGNLHLEFDGKNLTSHAGLELFHRYLRSTRFNKMVWAAFKGPGLGGDFGFVTMIRLLVALLWVGGRRVAHLSWLSHDPMVRRVVGLDELPHKRTVSRWLGRFREHHMIGFRRLNLALIGARLRTMKLEKVTVDLDGTIVSTGLQVERAARGFNPHHRKVPSYYPLLGHIAETGQFFFCKNRSGNVHDSNGADRWVREMVRDLRDELGAATGIEYRMDGAFFRRDVIEMLERKNCHFAVKVPLWRWLGLLPKIQMRTRWKRVTDDVDGFETMLEIPQWNMTLRVACYRKRVFHETGKNFQLDLFNEKDGTYEYSAVATNSDRDIRRLWLFMAGRGAQEKSIADLKDGMSFASVPSKQYGANSAWQWLSITAHNLYRDFQIESGMASFRGENEKTTYFHSVQSIKTARFEWLNVAGCLLRLAKGRTLRVATSPGIQKRFRQGLEGLSSAA